MKQFKDMMSYKKQTCENCGHDKISHKNGRGSCFNTDLIGYPCMCTRFKKSPIEISIINLNEDREIYIVTTKKGYCYYLNCARPFMKEAEIRELWAEDKKQFDKYYGQYGY